MSMNNEVAETLRALSENRNHLANIEDEKYNKAIAEQAARKKNYYNILEDRRAREISRSQLLEGARNDALSTIMKAIYISALEANTLTDNGIILAESMVDKWIAESGGASKILRKVSNENYFWTKIASLVEEAAKEEIDAIEMDGESVLESYDISLNEEYYINEEAIDNLLYFIDESSIEDMDELLYCLDEVSGKFSHSIEQMKNMKKPDIAKKVANAHMRQYTDDSVSSLMRNKIKRTPSHSNNSSENKYIMVHGIPIDISNKSYLDFLGNDILGIDSDDWNKAKDKYYNKKTNGNAKDKNIFVKIVYDIKSKFKHKAKIAKEEINDFIDNELEKFKAAAPNDNPPTPPTNNGGDSKAKKASTTKDTTSKSTSNSNIRSKIIKGLIAAGIITTVAGGAYAIKKHIDKKKKEKEESKNESYDYNDYDLDFLMEEDEEESKQAAIDAAKEFIANAPKEEVDKFIGRIEGMKDEKEEEPEEDSSKDSEDDDSLDMSFEDDDKKDSKEDEKDSEDDEKGDSKDKDSKDDESEDDSEDSEDEDDSEEDEESDDEDDDIGDDIEKADQEDSEDETDKGKIFSELDKDDDVKKAVEVIRNRVANAEEQFIKNNAEDKKKIDELLNKIANNVKTVEDLDDKDSKESKVAQESARLNRRRIDDIRENRPCTIFEQMARNLTENIIKSESSFDLYLDENGQLDIDLVIESAKVMYGFLETLNTLKLEKVNEAYITNILNEMK